MNREFADVDVSAFARAQKSMAPSRYNFDDVQSQVVLNNDDCEDLIVDGADLEPETLVDAYCHGLFPMPLARRSIGWFSPETRGVIPLDGFHQSNSLTNSLRRFNYSVDAQFENVMRACGDPRRPHGWINDQFIRAYTRLHEMGWAHSVEVMLDGELVGGVYGVRIGQFFAGESMFHTVTDASKAALALLVHGLNRAGALLFDVQWTTPHLKSLGAIDVPRLRYYELLAQAVETANRTTD